MGVRKYGAPVKPEVLENDEARQELEKVAKAKQKMMENIVRPLPEEKE
jgi:hypothetical protein